MVKTAARMELERAYRILVGCQDTNDQERHLRGALRVIAAYEAVIDEVTVRIEDVIREKALTNANVDVDSVCERRTD